MFFDGDFNRLEIPLVNGIFQEQVCLSGDGWVDTI
jgi:hypothetical protein